MSPFPQEAKSTKKKTVGRRNDDPNHKNDSRKENGLPRNSKVLSSDHECVAAEFDIWICDYCK